AADDAGVNVDQAAPCSATKPCAGSLRCYAGQCIPDNGTCLADNDCQNDTYCNCSDDACTIKICLPYGTPPRGLSNTMCTATIDVPALEWPKVRCSWQMGAVTMTPVVADLDGDGMPEILAIT